MKVTIYNAVSLDGFISGPEHETDWVSEADWNTLEKELDSADIVVMGSKTYEVSLEGDGIIPYGSVPNYVFTQRPEGQVDNELVHFTKEDPVGFVKNNAGKHVFVIGGGKLNATFLKSETVNDIIVTVHPIILGAGTRQFEDIDQTALTKLEKISEEDIGDGVVKIHYRVIG